jgi:2-(1,2-epoxy-1,2-dihydrophenyl)acetyl-CoA isomerase
MLGMRIADGIAWLVLSQPERLNPLGRSSMKELRHAVAAVAGDASVRAVILAGEGRAFSAGGDVAEFHAELSRAPAFLAELVAHLHAAITALLQMPKPVIAYTAGVVAGGGMGLFLAADLAIAAESASFVMAYTGIGASPDGGSTFFLPRVVGTRRALELALTNRRLTAREALDWGLVNQVVPDAEVEKAALDLATRLASGPTLAFAHARALLRQSFLHTPEAQMEHETRSLLATAATADFREGVTAFVERRPPIFTGG